MIADNPVPQSPFAHKIRPRHLDRLAVVYIRQSTPQQVICNRESADLQYQLRRRAVGLGWADGRVLVIDDDQGISGQPVENRPGFQRLLAEVSLGHVGIVFGREMSRLARSCKDWHQLLELCGLFQVLIGDADGVYDPADPNDRMLLGLRGMMSEAELHVLRSRLHQGKSNKARRGELFTCVPIGYVRTPDGGIGLDPDEQARSVVTLLFQKYAELGSLTKAHAFFVANGIQLGLRVYKGAGKGRLVWQRPRRSTLYEMLRHPFYAGAYAYGRFPLDPTRRAGGKKAGRRNAPPDEWVCLLRDKVPAYISWEQYEENRRRLAANDRGRGAKAATGRAPTLLNGIVRCGRCGKPMAAHNARVTAHPRYACAHEFAEYGGPRCQSVTAAYPDRLIETLVLKAVEPAALELSFRAAERVGQDRERLHAHWRQRLERAEYEAGRARRQYDCVDPENRLVARELERQWEQKLAERQRLDEDYARFRAEQPRHLTAADRDQIRALAADLPALWRAGTTTGADRRAVVRLLIERVELARQGETERVAVAVHWRGGTISRHEITQGLRKYTALDRYDALRERVIALRGDGKTADQIAEALNQEGYAVPRGERYTGHRVRQLFARLGLTGTPPGVRDEGDLPAPGEWWLPALASELGVKPAEHHHSVGNDAQTFAALSSAGTSTRGMISGVTGGDTSAASAFFLLAASFRLAVAASLLASSGFPAFQTSIFSRAARFASSRCSRSLPEPTRTATMYGWIVRPNASRMYADSSSHVASPVVFDGVRESARHGIPDGLRSAGRCPGRPLSARVLRRERGPEAARVRPLGPTRRTVRLASSAIAGFVPVGPAASSSSFATRKCLPTGFHPRSNSPAARWRKRVDASRRSRATRSR